MRFDQIDILVLAARNLGGLLMAGAMLGAAVTYGTTGPREDFILWPWVWLLLSGLSLVVFCTGVMAQIVTARAVQDGLIELRAIKEILKAGSAT